MTQRYALEVKQTDMPLLRFLNDGPVPLKRNYYLVFHISEDGREITTETLSKRQMFDRYDITKQSPLMLALKEV